MCRVSMMADECAIIVIVTEEQEPTDYRWAARSRWEAAGDRWIHPHPSKPSSQESRGSRPRECQLPDKLIGGVMGTGPITEDGGEHDDSDNEHWSKPDAAN